LSLQLLKKDVGITDLDLEVFQSGHSWNQLKICQVNDHASDLRRRLRADDFLERLIYRITDQVAAFFAVRAAVLVLIRLEEPLNLLVVLSRLRVGKIWNNRQNHLVSVAGAH